MMKKFLLSILILFLTANSSFAFHKKTKILIDDFRNTNTFNVFYIYNERSHKFEFIKLSPIQYNKLSAENKRIYRRVQKADNLMKKSNRAVFNATVKRYGQEAYQTNPDLVPVAYKMYNQFNSEKKYSTAAYYALKVKEHDKKGFYKDINYKIGELYYKLDDTENALKYLRQHEERTDTVKTPELYALLADSYAKEAQKQNGPKDFYKSSLQYADKAIADDTLNQEALEAKYISLYALKNYRSAMSAAAKLMEAEPKEYRYALYYADCRKMLKDKKTELIYLQKALKLAHKAKKKPEQKVFDEISARILILKKS